MTSTLESTIVFNEWTLFRSWLESISPSQYNYIYFSIGSKFNEPRFSFDNGKTVTTNAVLQMVPSFIENRLFPSENIPPPKILCICVDSFSDTGYGSIENNRNLVEGLLNPQIDFVIYDTFATLQMFETLIQYFVKWLKNAHFPSSRFLLANFIRFYRPNNIEYLIEDKLPDLILSIVKSTVYVDCFFQWFGYVYVTYNLLYRYNNRYILFDKALFSSSEMISYMYLEYSKPAWKDIVDLTSTCITDNIFDELSRFC